MNGVVGASLAAAVLGATFVFLVWRLHASTRVRDVNPDWLRSFSVEQYRPMERLLLEEDVEFLRSQPGYEAGMEKDLRLQRRKVFRAYLRCLGQDFNRLHLALRLLVLHAPEDRSDLAVTLVRQKLVFFGGLGLAHLKLSLHALGVGSVDVRGLVSVLETMRYELRSLLPATGQAAT